jgi:hypothetical protein
MNGFLNGLNVWNRLGLFTSVILGFLILSNDYLNSKTIGVYLDVPASYDYLYPQEFYNKVHPEALLKNDDLINCIKNTTLIKREFSGLAYIQCERKSYSRLTKHLYYVFFPFVIVFGFGNVFSWIISGFQKGKKTKLQKEQGDEE